MNLSETLNSLNYDKKNLMSSDKMSESDYAPFIVNKCFSYFTDTILYANEMNRNAHLENRLQYDYYLHSLRKRKRFSRWEKNNKSKTFLIVKEYYGYSNSKTEEVMDLLTTDQIKEIKHLLETGGQGGRRG
jgi:hypothetical protein|tara:strand:+ start:286 stop:678 length:393 start_codon:yes stop_codon:yes gene_type:complete